MNFHRSVPDRSRWLGFWFAAVLVAVADVHAATEEELLRLLRSDAGVVEKCEACRQLRVIGSSRAVPVLAALLVGDERLAHAARHALEPMPVPEAGAALRAALGRAEGLRAAGLWDSLGWRRDPEAVPLAASALRNSDDAVARAAATALGRIGTSEAAAALGEVRDRSGPALRDVVIEAILRCADRALGEGRAQAAVEACRPLVAGSESRAVREAAHGILFRALGDRALDDVLAELEHGEPAARAAALRWASEASDPRAAAALASRLPRFDLEIQIGVLGLLRARAEVAALPSVLPLAESSSMPLRAAALAALGTVGDATTVPALVAAASRGDETLRAAARGALMELAAPGAGEALARSFADAEEVAVPEIVRALVARQDRSAVPMLLALARSNSARARRGAATALEALADERDLAALVRWLVEAPTAEERDQARGIIEAMTDRPGGLANPDVTPLVNAHATAPGPARASLFAVMTRFPDPRLRPLWRAALGDADASLRRAVGRALCDARDPDLLPDLLNLSRAGDDDTLRILALRGYARLATDAAAVSDPARQAALLRDVLPVAQRPEERRQLLSDLTSIRHRDALALAERLGADAGLASEAEGARLRIAEGIASSDLEAAESTLEKLASSASREDLRNQARAALAKFRPDWLVAGPYRVPGKLAQELFDVVFPPEQPGSANVDWRRPVGAADPARAGQLDLSAVVQGDHCVVYLRTRLFAPRATDGLLLIGTDDGIRLWVNGRPAHANNAVRGLTPDEDRAKVALREGWNDVLAKITQHTAGCGMSFRVVGPDGAPIQGLKLDPGR